MQSLLFMLGLVVSAVVITYAYRRKRDLDELAARVTAQGGKVVKLTRVRRGHPFPDTGRGWWVWRVDWRSETADRRAWVLTTREGIKEWRD